MIKIDASQWSGPAYAGLPTLALHCDDVAREAGRADPSAGGASLHSQEIESQLKETQIFL